MHVRPIAEVYSEKFLINARKRLEILRVCIDLSEVSFDKESALSALDSGIDAIETVMHGATQPGLVLILVENDNEKGEAEKEAGNATTKKEADSESDNDVNQENHKE